MLQMQLLAASSAPTSFQLRYTFFMPTQLIVFCAKNVLQLRQKLLHHTNVGIVKFMAQTHTRTQS